jgi:hypothetical protein
VNPRPAPPPELAGRWLSKFFIDHLAGERAASPKTVSSYLDAMKLLLTWFRDAEHIPPEKLRLADIDRPRVLRFLHWLEAERNCSATSRNQRLAVIKLVEDMAKEVMQDWGTSGLDMRISAAQWRHPGYIWAYRGSEVHKEVARRLGQRYPDLFDGRMNGTGPDYSVKTGGKVELTTPGEVAGHKRKGGESDDCGYAVYNLKNK